jgi:hypothetical protein
MVDPVTARNRPAYERGQEHYRLIKAAMLEHARRNPLRPVSGKELHARFPHLGLSTVYWYMAQVREEAESMADSLESV